MGKKAKRAELDEDLRRLDEAHQAAVRAVKEADARAAKADRSARRQRAKAATALELASEELAALAAALRESGEPAPAGGSAADPLTTLSTQIDTARPELEAQPAQPAQRPRPAASRRASLHDSPIASMFQDSDAPRRIRDAAEPAPAPAAPQDAEPTVARARPGLVETWRRRVSAL